jgi:hypothetical protein
MADAKISALPASTTPLAGTEVLPIVQGGQTKQVSVANLTSGRAMSASSMGIGTATATGLLTLNSASPFMTYQVNNVAYGYAGSANELVIGGNSTELCVRAENSLILASGSINQTMRLHPSTGVSIGNTTDPGATNLSVTGTVRTGGYTVATLPAAGVIGRRAYVTDATLPTYLGALIGGGAVVCPVFDNGTAWVSA